MPDPFDSSGGFFAEVAEQISPRRRRRSQSSRRRCPGKKKFQCIDSMLMEWISPEGQRR